MSAFRALLVIAPLVAMPSLVAAHSLALSPDAGSSCTCLEAEATSGWCARCGIGWVASLQVPSTVLYDVLDPHGHDVDPEAVSCPSCLVGLTSGGYCEMHRVGFVDGRGYVSRIGYLFALGKPDDGTCPLAALGSHPAAGWCRACGQGQIGVRSFEDHVAFDDLLAERDRLARALPLVESCEFCAAAAFVDGRCPECRVSYRDGKPAPQKERGNLP